MPKHLETKVEPMRIRSRRIVPEAPKPPAIQWIEPVKKKRGEALMKNLTVSAALILCAVTLRTGAIPPLGKTADVIMTAATDNSLLDDQLGKLSFVSALFPEAVLVFGEMEAEHMLAPVSTGMVVHAWSEAEPYMSWRSDEEWIASSCAGEVIGVYHGNGDERLVQVQGSDGLSCLYGNLGEVSVQIGDSVSVGSMLGKLLPGEDCVFEVRRDGRSIDPAIYLAK